jgi:hypothetical protein
MATLQLSISYKFLRIHSTLSCLKEPRSPE